MARLIEIDPNVSQIGLFPNEDGSRPQYPVFKSSFGLFNEFDVYGGTPVIGRRMELIAQLGEVQGLNEKISKIVRSPAAVLLKLSELRELTEVSRVLYETTINTKRELAA